MNSIHEAVSTLSRPQKRMIVVMVDACLCLITVWLAYYLRLGEIVRPKGQIINVAVLSLAFALPTFTAFGLYRAIFRYSGWAGLVDVAKAILLYGLIFSVSITIVGIEGVPRTVGIIQPILLFLLICSSRTIARLWFESHEKKLMEKSIRPRVLIYGAGTSGRQLADAMAHNNEIHVIGFLDDDDRLHGHSLNGLKVYNPFDLSRLSERLNVTNVLLAMPSLDRKRRNEIISAISNVQVAVRTLPSFSDLAKGKVTVSDLHELDIDDLLGREPVVPNGILLAKTISKKIVMVTGAGGSIGSELCRQIASLRPKTILLVEQNEFALFAISQELEAKRLDCLVVPLLASVQDKIRLNDIISKWCPNTIFHAAAYKHVPLVEYNFVEGIKNNVLGTLVSAETALNHNVQNFVLVSTDKAVRPTNVMGASKRLAEMILQALADRKTETKFSIVRFGNVLASSGSVVPKFRQQLKNGGPITLTHPDVTRFFMTIPESAQLVIQAAAMSKGGEVFVLDMGEPVRIKDLARRIIELSGFSIKDDTNPDGDIEIEITGLRPGEKLYEELLIGDNPEQTAHHGIMKAHEEFVRWEQLKHELKCLAHSIEFNEIHTIKKILERLVPDYQADKQSDPLMYLNRSKSS